jgi:hypothetical protein
MVLAQFYKIYGFPNLFIIHIIVFPTHYLHYDNYGERLIAIKRIIGIIAIIYMYPFPCTFKWYMASDTGFNNQKAFVYIWGSYRSKNIAKSRW